MLDREKLSPLILSWQYRLIDSADDYCKLRRSLGWTLKSGQAKPPELAKLSDERTALAAQMGHAIADVTPPPETLSNEDLAWLIHSFPIMCWFRINCTVEWEKRGHPRLRSDFEQCIMPTLLLAEGRTPQRHPKYEGGLIPAPQAYAQHAQERWAVRA